MSTLRIIPIAAFICINTALSSKNNNCLQSSNDHLLFQSFQNMQSWFHSNLNDEKVKSMEKMEKIEETLNVTKHELEETKNLVNKLESQLKEHHNSEKLFESLKKWVNVKQDETNGQIDLRFKKLEEIVTANTHNLNDLKESFGKSQDNSRLLSLQQSVDQLQGKVNEIDKVHQQMHVLQKEMKETLGYQLSLIQKQESAIRNVENAASTCITDIKVSPSESIGIWKSPGYNDEGHLGYFLTGVNNHNRDKYADSAYRRKILFKRTNNWVPLHE